MTSKKKWRASTPPPVVKGHKIRPRKNNRTILVITALLLITFVVFAIQSGNNDGIGKKSTFPYAIANPASGAMAPDFSLPSTKGGSINLSDYRGKTVLLFFHEGIGCQPCWDQIRDLEKERAKLISAGIDQLLTITSGPTRLIAQKMNDDGLTSIALGDTNLKVSKNYHANQYGMMGNSRDGHTLILVGADGRIDWRADYGGPPNYTMYVPIETILSDLSKGRD